MKKNNIIGFIAALSLLGMTMSSCSLKENPKDQITDSEAYKSPALIYLNTVASLYNEIGGSGGSNGLGGADRGLYDLNTFTADEAILPTRGGDWYDGGLWQDLYKHQWSVDNGIIKGTWDYLYRVIGKANRSIDKLTSIATQDPNNTVIPVYIAELRAFRAMYYYYLMDLYGSVPVVTSSTQLISDVKQSKRSEVYTFVINEIQESLPLLSEANSAHTGAYYGRITKPVAYFLMAKLALNAEVYSDDNWADGNNGTYTFNVDGKSMTPWEATIHYCDAITALGYQLENDFRSNFSVKNEMSKENIFVIPMDPTSYASRMMMSIRSRHYEHGKAYNQEGWNGSSATKEALLIFRKGGDDPRLEMTFYTGKVYDTAGNPIMNGDVQLEYKPDAIALDLSNTADEKTAGARWAKYEIDPLAQGGGQLVHNDYVLFRYADVLLMKAEALVRSGQSGDSELNLVRARVGATARTATLQNILDERMLELAWEGHRRQDLIRFGQYTKAITDRPASDFTRTVFPIPNEVLNLNKNLVQNPGYN